MTIASMPGSAKRPCALPLTRHRSPECNGLSKDNHDISFLTRKPTETDQRRWPRHRGADGSGAGAVAMSHAARQQGACPAAAELQWQGIDPHAVAFNVTQPGEVNAAEQVHLVCFTGNDLTRLHGKKSAIRRAKR
ncbi:hypothetical protein BN439_3337 [Erwinia amylovora Ea644]|nr:hypothetical protein BN439_3337 [Erwinia amylovora Ea644]